MANDVRNRKKALMKHASGRDDWVAETNMTLRSEVKRRDERTRKGMLRRSGREYLKRCLATC